MTAIALNPHQSSAEAQKSMKERPILFSGPMVRALLDGSKTQTRRVVKPQPQMVTDHTIKTWDGPSHALQYQLERLGKGCTYGQPGDRLWVRETCRAEELPDGLDGVRYLADDGFVSIHPNEDGINRWLEMRDYGKRPSPVARVKAVPAIHMPRWASRITLEITGVLVERLQDISCHDALAEGIPRTRDGFGMPDGSHFHCNDPRQSYFSLWEAINGPGSVEANPWVWVVEFQRVKGLAG
jgi:hypothetical protein